VAPGFDNSLIHVLREAEIVAIDYEPPRLRHLACFNRET
jgi:hypothetical protein